MADKPSDDYFRALDITKNFHETKKLFTGRYIRFYSPFIKQICDNLGCKTMLDYGCGKGKQWTERFDPEYGGFFPDDEDSDTLPFMSEYFGVDVTLYDPGVKEFAQEPTGKFDIVICTQVLANLPSKDIPWVISRLFSLASKAVFVGEKGGTSKKRQFDPVAHLFPGDWEPENFIQAMKNASVPGIEGWFGFQGQLTKVC